ncbi:MAG: hypothetical protein H7Y37_06335 [Anaerolineae bacterium]|nr:hypothetical protein [Gloeobacterales cyanobacterium ES-bin-313]
MQDDTQFQPVEQTRSGPNPLLFVALGIVALGGGGWYFLQQQSPSPEAPVVASAPKPALTKNAASIADVPVVPTKPAPPVSGTLIPVTSPQSALIQAKTQSGKDDPFRTVATAPAAIKAKPVKVVKLPPAIATVVPKEFFAKTITVVGIVDTPKNNYAILSYQGREEIAHVGDAVQSSIVKSISAQTRTVVFREQGEDVIRALEVNQ